MENIKKCYNSEESKKDYILDYPVLTNNESRIFDLFDKDLKILDLWCWWWRTTISLIKKWFKNVLWVDFAENLINWAKKKYKEFSKYFQVWDAANLISFKNEEFDMVFFSFNWIDYLQTKEDRFKAYSEINRVLKNWWFFLFSSHNRHCLPINRNLLRTIVINIFNIFSEYWTTKQNFWNIKTYYSTEKLLENDLKNFWFSKLWIFCDSYFLYPFFQTFPYYIYKKC